MPSNDAVGGETPPPSPPHCQLSPARYQTWLRHPLHCRLSPAGYQIQLQCLFLNALRGVVDGLHHITYYIEQNQAQLAVIAQEVDPIEFAVWLLVLCQKMEVFYAIVKGKSRHGAFVHKKTATALCLTSMKKGNC